MSIREMLSPAVEDYLKAIYKLQSESNVSTSGLAGHLGVASASVTKMVKRLSGLGLVTYASYKGVRLTAAGEKIALEIVRHHRLLETYLREIMGYDWETMHAEAEHLEHHISEEFEDRLDKMLGYPTHDPHGDPIPSRDGVMINVASEPLVTCPINTPLIVRRVADTDPGALQKLEHLGLLPGAKINISGGNDHVLEVTTDGSTTEMKVEHDLAAQVFASTEVE